MCGTHCTVLQRHRPLLVQLYTLRISYIAGYAACWQQVCRNLVVLGYILLESYAIAYTWGRCLHELFHSIHAWTCESDDALTVPLHCFMQSLMLWLPSLLI